VLIAPVDVPQRSPFTAEGFAMLLHAVAHIEFNAIEMAFFYQHVTPVDPDFMLVNRT
jgi:uncharacterized ferritin-like protein (DUF455 family)